MQPIRWMHESVILLSQIVRYRTHLQCKRVTRSLTHGPGWATFLVPDPKRMDMSTRNDTNDQNKAADEAARTARTVTNEAARVGEQTARAGADMFRPQHRDRTRQPANGPEHGHPDLPAHDGSVHEGAGLLRSASGGAGPPFVREPPGRVAGQHGSDDAVLRRSRRRCSASFRIVCRRTSTP